MVAVGFLTTIDVQEIYGKNKGKTEKCEERCGEKVGFRLSRKTRS